MDKSYTYMDQKFLDKTPFKIISYLSLLIFGAFIFFLISMLTSSMSILVYIFFGIYAISLIFIAKGYSHKKLFLIISIFLIYFLINIITFSECDRGESWGIFQQNCECLGIEVEKGYGIVDGGNYSECIGIIKSHTCKALKVEGVEGLWPEVSCDSDLNTFR